MEHCYNDKSNVLSSVDKPGVPRISVFTGSKLIAPVLEACARPKSATYFQISIPSIKARKGVNTVSAIRLCIPLRQSSHPLKYCWTLCPGGREGDYNKNGGIPAFKETQVLI